MVKQPLILTETFALYPLSVVIAKSTETPDAGGCIRDDYDPSASFVSLLQR